MPNVFLADFTQAIFFDLVTLAGFAYLAFFLVFVVGSLVLGRK